MTRRERIVFLLDHLSDCFDPAGTTSGEAVASSARGGVPLSPAMSTHPSVVELCRCLNQLEKAAPNHARYLWTWFGSGWTVEWIPKRSGSKTLMRIEDGRKVPVLEPLRRRAAPSWFSSFPVDRETGEPRPVALAVDFVSNTFRGEVFVPSELIAA